MLNISQKSLLILLLSEKQEHEQEPAELCMKDPANQFLTDMEIANPN